MPEITEWYIVREPFEDGWYGCAQNPKFENSVMLPVGELFDEFMKWSGYVNITLENDVVTSVTVNQEAFDAFQERINSAPVPPDPEEEKYRDASDAIKSSVEL